MLSLINKTGAHSSWSEKSTGCILGRSRTTRKVVKACPLIRMGGCTRGVIFKTKSMGSESRAIRMVMFIMETSSITKSMGRERCTGLV